MNKFKELGLSEKLSKNLEKLKITEPTEIQEKTIPLTLKGKDVIGGSATGSGKTISFASTIIENIKSSSEEGIQALILTPTRELAEQISDAIKEISEGFPVKVMSIYGGVSIENQFKKIPKSNIVVGTPGRVLDHLKRRTLNLSKVKYLVLDEVDRMFEMGFQEDVEKIIYHCTPKEKRQTMMFSATITPEIDFLSRKHTKNAQELQAEEQVDPSKLKQVFYDTSPRKKFSLLVHLLKEENSETVMVFCNTRRNVDFVADNLKLNGINAQAIHGGLNQNKRKDVLKNFHKKELNVLVCTDVAARGLDIKGVTHVYNYDIPENITDYTHRIGRTARAGKEGKVINIVSDRDYIKFGDIEGSDDLNIEQLKMPEPSKVKIKIPNKDRNFNKNKGGFQRNRNNSQRNRGNSQRGRGNSQRNRRDSAGNRGSSQRNRRDSQQSRRNDSNFKKRKPNFSKGPRNNNKRNEKR